MSPGALANAALPSQGTGVSGLGTLSHYLDVIIFVPYVVHLYVKLGLKGHVILKMTALSKAIGA